MPPVVTKISELKKEQVDDEPFASDSDAIEFIKEIINIKDAMSWIGTRSSDAFYKSQKVFRVLTYAGLDQTSIKDASGYLVDDISKTHGQTPSDDTVYRTLEEKYGTMSREEIEDMAAAIMQSKVESLPEIKRARKRNRILLEGIGLEISIDPHEERCYPDKHFFDEEGKQLTMLGQLKENRGRKVFRYSTAAIVWPDEEPRPPLTIGIVLIHKGQSRSEILKRLMYQIEKMEIKINLLSGDGEFGSKGVMQYLDNLPKSKRPKKVLFRGKYFKSKDYPGEIGQRFPYDLNEGTKNAYRVEGYLIEQKTPEGTETRFFISSKHYHFTTSEIEKIYKRRFRIENTFRHTRVCKIRTTMKSIVKRIALWAFCHYLELLWEIYRIYNQIGTDYDYNLRQKRFVKLWRSYLEQQIRNEKAVYLLKTGKTKNQVLRKLGLPMLICCKDG